MYIAELKGKIPSNLEKMEDVLTSNVFSFFKYSKRTIYLKSLLNQLGINASDRELNEAEFIFWPVYEDGTEPDLVIIVGDYYLLFESKYFSDFGAETLTATQQLIREATEGPKDAKNIGKIFYLVAVTADYCFKPDKFNIIKNFKINFKWMNWQTVAELILNLIEKEQEKLPDLLFANDLYKLLDKKKLRAFRSFKIFANIFISRPSDNLFFYSEISKSTGYFTGFLKELSDFPIIEVAPEYIFFNKNI